MKKIVPILILSILVFACEDKDKTKLELLTDSVWQLSSMNIEPAAPAIQFYNDTLNPMDTIGFTKDGFSLFRECFLDDLKQYNSDGSLLIDEGETKCSPTDPQSFKVDWYFNPDQTVINDDYGNNYIESYKIIELSDSKLVMSTQSYLYGFPDEEPYTLTLTYVAK